MNEGRTSGKGALARALLAAGFLACSPVGPDPDRPPDLLLITADDMGMEVGAYGDAHATTPAIDRLADAGLRFDSAFVVSSTCSPSRAGILTGIHPHGNGHWGFPKYTRLRGNVRTLPDYFAGAGYYTGMIGKFMVGGEEGQFPFDMFILRDLKKTRDPSRIRRLTRDFFQRAGQHPFFLMVNLREPHSREGTWRPSPDAPHDPSELQVPATDLDTPGVRRILAARYDAYARADSGVAAVLESLEEAGRSDSTLVVFLSDHGPGVPSGKGTLYESGIHVPMIARWPGVITPGRSTDALVSTIDILPTFVAAAGIPPNDEVQGTSLLGLMGGTENEVRSAIFAGTSLLQGNRYFPQRAIRTARHKYVRNLRPDIEFLNNSVVIWGLPMMIEWDTNPWARFLLERNVRHPREELYDLETDPWELENLATRPDAADVLARLRQRLRERLVETGDPWIALWDYDGSERDPFEPAETESGPFEAQWLDAALRSPRLRGRYRRYFGRPATPAIRPRYQAPAEPGLLDPAVPDELAD